MYSPCRPARCGTRDGSTGPRRDHVPGPGTTRSESSRRAAAVASRDLHRTSPGATTSRCEVVDKEVPPVVALRVPQDLVRAPQHLAADPGLVVRGHLLADDGPHRTGGRVRDTQDRLLVIPRGGDERDMPRIGTPLS